MHVHAYNNTSVAGDILHNYSFYFWYLIDNTNNLMQDFTQLHSIVTFSKGSDDYFHHSTSATCNQPNVKIGSNSHNNHKLVLVHLPSLENPGPVHIQSLWYHTFSSNMCFTAKKKVFKDKQQTHFFCFRLRLKNKFHQFLLTIWWWMQRMMKFRGLALLSLHCLLVWSHL